MPKLSIDIWSDVACPWCWVGKRRLEAALADFEHKDNVEITWRAFELKPDAPAVEQSDPNYVERLANKYRVSTEQAQAMIDRMTNAGAEDGLTFRFDIIRPGNTFDAHRLLHLAGHVDEDATEAEATAAHQKQDQLKERFLKAYFEEGKAIGDKAVLHDLALEQGLAPDKVTEVLESNKYGGDVRMEEQGAQQIGITGVPFFVFGKKFAVSGAQPADALLSVLRKAWSEIEPTELTVEEGAACGIDGC